MLNEKRYSSDLNLNKFFIDLKLKKKIKRVLVKVSNIRKSNYKCLNSSFFGEHDLQNVNSYLVTYIIDIAFSRTNTLFHIMDFSGNLKFFFFFFLFNYKGKRKASSRMGIVKDFCRTLSSTRFSYLHNKPVSLHLKNVGRLKYQVIKKLKKKKFRIKVVRNFSLYPHNGCRKKKVRRKKFRTSRKNKKR